MKQYKTKYTKMTVPSNLDIQLGLAKVVSQDITITCYAKNKQDALANFIKREPHLNWLRLKNIEIA